MGRPKVETLTHHFMRQSTIKTLRNCFIEAFGDARDRTLWRRLKAEYNKTPRPERRALLAQLLVDKANWVRANQNVTS